MEGRTSLSCWPLTCPLALTPTAALSTHSAYQLTGRWRSGLSKIGLHTLPGASHVGTVEVADVGIPSSITDLVTTELMTREWAAGSVATATIRS